MEDVQNTEKPAAPNPKTRLVFSIIVLLAGLIVLYGVEPFDSQELYGWGLTGLGALSVLYNLWCMKTGRYM